MKIDVLGCGSAFSSLWTTSFVIESNNKRLLLDCGTDIRHSANQNGLKPTDFDVVYISHIHSDHVAGLEWLAFNPLTLFAHISYKKYLMQYIEEVMCRSIKNSKPSDFFNLCFVQNGFSWQDLYLELIPNEHSSDMISYGILIGDKVYFSTDSKKFNQKGSSAELIFHDCETGKTFTGLHSRYEDLVKLPEKIKSKIKLVHYNDNPSQNAEKDGFLGFAQIGETFDLQ